MHRQNADETATPGDISVSAPVLAPGGGTQAQVKVEGGLSGATYRFSFLAHDDGDDGGDVLKLDGLLRVRDR